MTRASVLVARKVFPETVARLREQGVLCTGLYKLRLVTHLDVSAGDIDRAVRILRETL